MSIIDKAMSAITPTQSEEARAKAPTKAEAAANPGDWLLWRRLAPLHGAIEGYAANGYHIKIARAHKRWAAA